ncbi:MAG TPA: amidohydrolase family protein [Mobilitalea sp.]|nr:amidohydrolase family protein [Mobilitalea sp.]
MVIDFHTHIFPDKIAGKTIKALAEVGNVKAFTDGTLDGLKKSMKEQHIDISVVLPVVTKPAQFDTVNTFAAQITGKDGIISFGGIHPDTEDYREKLEQIKALGLQGIKLHPDYQETYVDDPKQVNVIKYAVSLGLIVIIHAGLDIGLPNPIHCPPKRAANMLRQIDDENAKIIFAHMGGFDQWDDVEEYLVGKNIWFDTSFSLGKINDDQFVRIVKNHGADRILFATDSPWDGQKAALDYIKKLDFTEEELERILFRNAVMLLGLE